MNNIDLSYGNGFPFESKTLDFMQTDYKTALKGIAGIGGNGDFIISGMVQIGGNMSAGWIYYQGDLVFFEAGVKQDNFIIVDDVENKIYQDGVSHPAYITRHAKFGLGTNPILFSTLKRLPSLLNMQSLITSLIGFETSVVVAGCDISGVSVFPTTLIIAAGLVMIDNNVLSMPGYTGAYPVWANADGNWVNVQPVTGSFIKFDPYTSQGKDSVIRRAVNRVGMVVMMTVLNDRFDNTGLGKWEMTGFALMNGTNGTLDIRDRMPLAYDGRGSDPANNTWDPNYQAGGNIGGEKQHTIARAELPNISLDVVAADGSAITYGAEDHGHLPSIKNNVRTDVDSAYGPIGFKTAVLGSGTAMENRPPYMVLVFAQRI